MHKHVFAGSNTQQTKIKKHPQKNAELISFCYILVFWPLSHVIVKSFAIIRKSLQLFAIDYTVNTAIWKNPDNYAPL